MTFVTSCMQAGLCTCLLLGEEVALLFGIFCCN
jgi:hypothetical protein